MNAEVLQLCSTEGRFTSEGDYWLNKEENWWGVPLHVLIADNDCTICANPTFDRQLYDDTLRLSAFLCSLFFFSFCRRPIG